MRHGSREELTSPNFKVSDFSKRKRDISFVLLKSIGFELNFKNIYGYHIRDTLKMALYTR